MSQTEVYPTGFNSIFENQSMNRIIIKSKRIVTPSGVLDGMLKIENGKIIFVGPVEEYSEGYKIIDAGNNVVMPGVIDPHVHINEPGRTDWEGFDTATRAAAAGGITTVIDMPLNSTPVTTSLPNLELKIAAAEKSCHVNCGFYGGVVPGNYNDLEKLISGGVFGLKAFLTHSGIEDFPDSKTSDLRQVLLLLKKHNLPLLVHCELSEAHEGTGGLDKNPQSYNAYLNSRPRDWENNAIREMIKLCRDTGAHVHIVHLSSSEVIPELDSARKEGLRLTVETAPHYLFFNSESITDNNTLLKCAPPIREKENNEKLWQALKNGVIDFIATDHSPAPPEMKEITSGNFQKAWGGIAGLQFSLPAIWTAGQERNITLSQVNKWMSENPAKFLGLKHKGKIAVGCDADIVIWDDSELFSLNEDDIFHRHKASPYAGLKLKGRVIQTIAGGKIVYDKNKFTELHAGKILLKRK